MTFLERHDDAANLHRFYSTEISRDLFGAFMLIRRWGRVGRRNGQTLVESYATREEAEAAEQTLTRAKSRRGYR